MFGWMDTVKMTDKAVKALYKLNNNLSFSLFVSFRHRSIENKREIKLSLSYFSLFIYKLLYQWSYQALELYVHDNQYLL